MAKCDIGVYGMAVMGQNLALNMADSGFKVAVYNRTTATTEEFMKAHGEAHGLQAGADLADFIALLEKPRVILLIVKAGAPVDAVIEALLPHLEEGDIVIDGGNSYFRDTDRRTDELAAKGIHYIGMGVSGGEEGARHGPSMMPGGTPEAYARIQKIMEATAANVDGDPCVTYLGPRSAGHYVKMVHNGIEYGNMQAIAEIYDLMKRGLGMDAKAIGEVFARWNQGALASFLVEITAQIFSYTDPDTGEPLVDKILDSAQQKGTGKWTTQDALDLGVNVPTITAAVEARIMSALKPERVAASDKLRGPQGSYGGDQDEFIDALENALFATFICAYAQGFAAMRLASEEYGYNLNMGDIARIWRGGCIIRAALLEDIRVAYRDDESLVNLMVAPHFSKQLAQRQQGWRHVIQTAVQLGIPVPALSSALAYYDGYRTDCLPANLIQAQRDFFGAHTYERTDKDGTFHTEWQG